MDILNPEAILRAHFVGRTVSKQPGVPEYAWGARITAVWRDEATDWHVGTDRGRSFTLPRHRELGVEPQ